MQSCGVSQESLHSHPAQTVICVLLFDYCLVSSQVSATYITKLGSNVYSAPVVANLARCLGLSSNQRFLKLENCTVPDPFLLHTTTKLVSVRRGERSNMWTKDPISFIIALSLAMSSN
jgi:hypothetical protein